MTRDDNKHMSVTFATKSAQICACYILFSAYRQARQGDSRSFVVHRNSDSVSGEYLRYRLFTKHVLQELNQTLLEVHLVQLVRRWQVLGTVQRLGLDHTK